MEAWLRWSELFLDINHWNWYSQRTIFQIKHFSPLQKIYPSNLNCPRKVMCSILFVNDKNYTPSPVITFDLYHDPRLLWITQSPIIPCTVRGIPPSLHWLILADFRQQPDQATFKHPTALPHRVALGQDDELASHGLLPARYLPLLRKPFWNSICWLWLSRLRKLPTGDVRVYKPVSINTFSH